MPSAWREEEVLKGVHRGAHFEGHRVKAMLELKLNQPGSGIIYNRPVGIHQASAEGEPPAPETGDLRDSITVAVRRFTGGSIARITVTDRKAVMLELGTRYMGPRPYMAPVIREVRATLLVGIRKEMNLAMKLAGKRVKRRKR